jgi:hypothetical protein
VLVLVGQIEHEEPLPWDVEPMNSHEVVEHPARGRVLDALAFLGWKRRSVLLERAAAAVLSGGIDEQIDRHDHQQRHDAFRLCQLKRGGQKLRGFQEAKATFRLDLPLIASSQPLRR